MKDNFSNQSKKYFEFRPTYPAELLDFIAALCPHHQLAWDCGTGNGQLANELTLYFDRVIATDISENQLSNAVANDKITYRVESAELTQFSNDTLDLITAAQAVHWFNFNMFYQEVFRTIKNNGIIAIIGYDLFHLGTEIDKTIQILYQDILGPFWDRERKYIDEKYRTIPFPFSEIKSPELSIKVNWRFEQLIGYLRTWSAVKHYIERKENDPVDLVYNDLEKDWGNKEYRELTFPLLLRVGQVKK